jgi:hypothetical protein
MRVELEKNTTIHYLDLCFMPKRRLKVIEGVLPLQLFYQNLSLALFIP